MEKDNIGQDNIGQDNIGKDNIGLGPVFSYAGEIIGDLAWNPFHFCRV
jgi:hypothetical protein